MKSFAWKSIATGLVALTFGLGVAATTTPASAQVLRGGHGFSGSHGSFGGHGNFGGGGWRHGGGWGGRGWGGGGWGLGAGLAAGALLGAATYPYWGYDGYYNGYDNGCLAYRPVYNSAGAYIGRRLVNICS